MSEREDPRLTDGTVPQDADYTESTESTDGPSAAADESADADENADVEASADAVDSGTAASGDEADVDPRTLSDDELDRELRHD